MKLVSLVLLLIVAASCSRPRTVKYKKVNPAYDGYILTNENDDRSFLIQLKDSTSYIITEGVFDTTEQVFVYPNH